MSAWSTRPPCSAPAIAEALLAYLAGRAAAAGMIDGVLTLRDAVTKFRSGQARLRSMGRRAAILTSTI